MRAVFLENEALSNKLEHQMIKTQFEFMCCEYFNQYQTGFSDAGWWIGFICGRNVGVWETKERWK